MLTNDEIWQLYDDGMITTDELFGLLLPMLARVPPEAIHERLRTEAGLEDAFAEWIGAVASGAEVIAGSRPVHVSDDDRIAIARFREHTRAARYAKLADHMWQWMMATHAEEPCLGPDARAPFRWKGIEPLLGEGAQT